MALTATTWDPANKGAAITLSNGNLTATNSTATQYNTVSVFRANSAAKYYWEILAVKNQASSYCGICNASFSLTATPNTGAYAVMLLNGGNVYVNGVNKGSVPGVVFAQRVPYGIAVDTGAALMWLRALPFGQWNFASNADPASGVGGIDISPIITVPSTPMLAFVSLGSTSGASITANFGINTFIGNVPSGFQAGLNLAGTPTPIVPGWSVSDAAVTNSTLSNSNMTCAFYTNGNHTSIRNATSQSAGKLYLEWQFSSNANTQNYLGVANINLQPVNSQGLGASGNSYSAGVGYSSNQVSDASAFTSNYTIAQGVNPNDTWGLAVDFTAKNIWLAQNNVWVNSSNPATGTAPILSFTPSVTGPLFAALDNYANTPPTVILNSTPGSFKYAPPSGFVAWDSPVVGALNPAMIMA